MADPNEFERALASDAFEHDNTSNVKVKRVGLHGWDVGSLEYKKVAVDATGKLKVDVDMATEGIATEATLALIKEDTSEYGINAVEVASATITYVGKENDSGNWAINKIDTSSGIVATYASILNNPSVLTYTSAWSARATLDYGNFSDI